MEKSTTPVSLAALWSQVPAWKKNLYTRVSLSRNPNIDWASLKDHEVGPLDDANQRWVHVSSQWKEYALKQIQQDFRLYGLNTEYMEKLGENFGVRSNDPNKVARWKELTRVNPDTAFLSGVFTLNADQVVGPHGENLDVRAFPASPALIAHKADHPLQADYPLPHSKASRLMTICASFLRNLRVSGNDWKNAVLNCILTSPNFVPSNDNLGLLAGFAPPVQPRNGGGNGLPPPPPGAVGV